MPVYQTCLVSVLLLLGWYGQTSAVRTVSSDGAIVVKLEFGQPTAVVLPEAVSTVTTGMKKDVLEVSKDNMNVGFIALHLELPPNRNFVVGVSGRIYMVLVELVAPGKRGDDIVYVTHKAPEQGEILTPVSVIRRLRDPRGLGPAVQRTLALPTTNDSRITLTTAQQYQIGPYQALMLTIENTQDTALALDERVGLSPSSLPDTVQLTTWVWPPGRRLSAVAVEHAVVLPRGATTIYAVFEER